MSWHSCRRWTDRGLPCAFLPDHLEEVAEIEQKEKSSIAPARERTQPGAVFELAGVMSAAISVFSQQAAMVVALADGLEKPDATAVPAPPGAIDQPDERQFTGDAFGAGANAATLPNVPAVRPAPLTQPTFGDRVVGFIEEALVEAVSVAVQVQEIGQLASAQAAALSYTQTEEIGSFSGARVLNDVAAAAIISSLPGVFSNLSRMTPITDIRPESIQNTNPSRVMPPKMQLLQGGRAGGGVSGLGFYVNMTDKILEMTGSGSPIHLPKEVSEQSLQRILAASDFQDVD